MDVANFFKASLKVNVINEFEKKLHLLTKSPSRSISKKIKCLGNYIPINKIVNILNEKHIGLKIDEIVRGKDFKKSDVEIERYESKEDVELP